eukprot:UN26059
MEYIQLGKSKESNSLSMLLGGALQCHVSLLHSSFSRSYVMLHLA